MAATRDPEAPPTKAQTALAPDVQDDLSSPTLQALAVGLGMDPTTKHELMKPDVNFLQEIAKLPLNLAEIPSGTDVQAMRHWINEVFLNGDFAEARSKCDVQLRRPKQKIDKTVVSVNASDGSGDQFELWIYETRVNEISSKTTSRPAIVMLHGGGWIHGTPLGDETIAEIFASDLNAVVIGVDYRLAPEYPFPAAIDDCVETLDWIVQHATKYRIDTERIALWGASAGGNIAAGLALKLSSSTLPETNQAKLCFVSLVAPVTAHPKAQALAEERRSYPKSQNEALFADVPSPPAEVIAEFEKLFGFYLGDADPCNPLVSPLVGSPASQHPPTHITVTACDRLRTQGLAYAELLRSSGIQATDEILPGVPHGFTFTWNANVTRGWIERERDRFAQAFGV